MNYVKYPRTLHLPWSPGLQNDDRLIESLDGFVGKQVVEMWRSMGLTCLANEWHEGRDRYAGMTNLTMMIGPSGSGKSTYAQDNFPSNTIVSTDQIRQDEGLTHHPDDLRRTWELAHGMIMVRLQSGFDTVLDATNIKQADRLKVLKFVPKGQLVRYVVIDRDLDSKLRTRGERSEELVLKHHRTFVSQLPHILNGDDQPNVIILDKRLHKV